MIDFAAKTPNLELQKPSQTVVCAPDYQCSIDLSGTRAAMSPSETDGLCDSGVAGVNQPVIWDLMVERIAGLNQSGEKLTEAWSAGVIEWKDASSWVRRAQQKGPELHPDSL